MDFAALRGTPDVSKTASEEASRCLQMREAVRLAAMKTGSDSSRDCVSLSQHPLAIDTMASSNTSLGSCLSQHPLSLSGHILSEQKNHSEEETSPLGMGGKTFGSKEKISGVLSSQKLPNQQDLFLLDNSVPAPLLLEILEKEMGLPKQYGFLSSESSSGKSVLGKDPEGNETSQAMEDVVFVEREPATFVEPPQQGGDTFSELEPFKVLSDSERKPSRNASSAEKISANTPQALVSFEGHRMGLGDSCSNTGISSRPLQNKPQIQQVSDVVSALADGRLNAPVPVQPVAVAAEQGKTSSRPVNTVMETQMEASKNELTHSGFSIEREHKDTGISPSFNEGSFFGHLGQPVHHSTPGLFTARNVRQEASGLAIPIKPVLQSPLSCLHEEISRNSSGDARIPSTEEPRILSVDDTGHSAEEPLTLKSEQEGKNESSGGPQVLHPLKGRIQSLPSLNFMEKVGAWNMSQSVEMMSDAFPLHSSSGTSPKQKAYSAIGGSLNSILLKHQSQFDLKPGSAAKSTVSLHSYDKKSPRALPLTRSQSENSVIAISREMSNTEGGHEKIQEDNLQPTEDKGHISGDSEVKQAETNKDDTDLLIQHHTAVLISTVSSDEETSGHVESGRSSDPDNLITSERVAELLREETGSLSGGEEKSGGTPDNTQELPGFHLRTNRIGMDHFRDVSPDSLNQLTSSGPGSPLDLRLSSGQSSRQSSAVSGNLQSSLEDVLQTPGDKDMNIEERIPVYLHNLGIDQSPSSILTPFLPRGPIREIELSPTELRTLKASTDLLTQCMQLSEGDLHPVIDPMQTSFNSSIFSGTVPSGSHTDPGSPLPTEHHSLSSGEVLSEGRKVCRQLQLHAPLAPQSESTSQSIVSLQSAEQSQVNPEVPFHSHSEEKKSPDCVQALTDRTDSKKLGVSEEKPLPGSEAQENAEKGLCREVTSLHVISVEEKDDSFIGSKTLKEIEKLLAERVSITSGRNSESFMSSSTDRDGSSKELKKINDTEGLGPVKGSNTGMHRMRSWDEMLSRQNFQVENRHTKTLSLTGSLKWDGLLAVDICRKGQVAQEKLRPACKAASEEYVIVKSLRRSEPEGCNSVMVNKSLPFSGNSAAKSHLVSPTDLKECQAPSSVKSSNSQENAPQVLEETKGSGNKGMGNSRESENSSSLDSLGIKVKNLLRYERPVLHTACWLDKQECSGSGLEKGSVGAGSAASKGDIVASQSDNSSSLDSLAARVKTLLEEERPVMHAIQILKSAEEEEAKAHAWVKVKQPAQPPSSVPDLNEEDRRMIEQIKREHPLSARTTGIPQGQLRRIGRISSPDPISKLNPDLSKLSTGNEPQKAIHTQNFQLAEFPEVSARPIPGTDRALQSELETKSLNRIQSHAYNKLQTHSDNFFGSEHGFYVPLGGAIDTNLMELTSASRAIVGDEVKASTQAKLNASNSSTEPAKQITSITFTSRKRSYSPASCSDLCKVTPCDSVPLESQPVNNEQLKSAKPQQDTFKPSALAGTIAVHMPGRSVGFSSGRDCYQDVSIVGIKGESHQEKPVEESQASCIEQKIHLTEDCREAQASSQILTERRRSGTLLGDVYDNKSNPKGMMADLSFSINVSQKKTDDGCPQDRSADNIGDFPHTPKPQGKESTLVKESKLAFDSQLGRAEDMDIGSNSPLLPSPDHRAAILPGSPTPTRKALSGVHITLSPKLIDLDLPCRLDPGAETRQVDGVKSSSQPATANVLAISSEATSRPIELSSKDHDSSYFPTPLVPDFQSKPHHIPVVAERAQHRRQELLESRQSFPAADQRSARKLRSSEQSLEESSKTTAASQTERMSSDAITQITTESPEKTTYSAEIFVNTDNSKMDAPRPLHQKRQEILSTTTTDVNSSSILNRQADPPLLLPYKPPGSSEMYYVPCSKEMLRLSRITSETTVESSHSGSNDAIPPKFPAQALGSRDDSPPDAVAIKHKEGIYSKRTGATEAWTEQKMPTWEDVRENVKTRAPLESVKKSTHSIFRPGEFYLHHPVTLQHETENEALRQPSMQELPATSSKNFSQHKGMPERNQDPFSLGHWKGEENFSPLNAEPDYSFLEELRFNKALEADSPRREPGQPERRKTGHEVVKEPLLPGSQRTGLKEKPVADYQAMQSAHFTGSLDELWTKYLERQKQQHQPQPCIPDSSSRNELSLVERLDRLARLLQNPVRHSLQVPVKDEQSCVQGEAKGKEPRKTSSHGRVAYRSKEEERPGISSTIRLSKSRAPKSGVTPSIDAMCTSTEKHQDFDTLSETSSEMQPVRDSSVLSDNTYESGVTQLETDSATRTEASGSVSTIDTARLVRAFGQDRVHISPKLSQLYSTINLQKTRLEKRPKGSRRARAIDHPKTSHEEPTGKNTQATDSFISSDSVSTASSSRGPSSALSCKRSARMLNKAIQAGDFEIVNSATKKHTRDVGLTFPTPTSSHAKLQGNRGSGVEEELSQADGCSLESKGKQRRQPSSFLGDKRSRKSKSQWLQGVSWFVPAEDLKADPKSGNESNSVPEPGPSWFEPLPNRKPWREPLREKNWQEDHGGLQVRLAAPARDIENNPPSPFVKITLQEALALRRPDFISSSGERMKRLKLIIEERKLQSMLQGEREELFNPPEHRRSYRNSAFLAYRGYRTIRKKGAISKNEMVQRSRRIYEQLPEVRKRREEEKRKSEYSTNRLKAQLYKTKITNRILGRKVPWE